MGDRVGRSWWRIGGVVLLLLAMLLGLAWWQRTQLASGALDRELARRGVVARYRVTEIGFRWQRLEDVVLGDPRRPDLAARVVEVRVAPLWQGMRVEEVRAEAVRLRGSYENGRLRLGEIDKLLQKAEAGKPFALPDLLVRLRNARVALATPVGLFDARIDGAGRLSDGFEGRVRAAIPELAADGCQARGVEAALRVRIARQAPVLNGPIGVGSVLCSGISADGLQATLQARLSPTLDHWQGEASWRLAGLASGQAQGRDLQGAATFAGDRRATSGESRLAARTGQVGGHRLAGLTLTGRYRLGRTPGLTGQVTVAALRPDTRLPAQLAALADKTRALPVGPVLTALAEATGAAAQSMAAAAQIEWSDEQLRVTQAHATTARGARLLLEGGEGISSGPNGLSVDTRVTLAGGGFPSMTGQVRRSTAALSSGSLTVAPYSVRDGSLRLAPVALSLDRAGQWRVRTTAAVSGPLGDGKVTGLVVPLDVRGAGGTVAVNHGCVPVAFDRLAVSGLVLDPTRLTVCPTGDALLRFGAGGTTGGARLRTAGVTGRIGGTSLRVVAERVELSLGQTGFRLTQIAARFGPRERESRLDLAQLSGRATRTGIGGRFAGASGRIGQVPILLDDGRGDWRLEGGRLSLSGQAMVSDAAGNRRFNPMRADAIRLTLAQGQVRVTGLLREPASKREVADVLLRHDLRQGRGNADLRVAGLTFGPGLQPEALTPLTVGVAANVVGQVDGAGRIEWSPSGVTSRGTFSTDDLDLAAAFGPVEGVKGTIRFSDLLGLVTDGTQELTVASVNPGLPVFDGRVRYRLLAGQRLAVAEGVWPYAGGTLTLLPTVLQVGAGGAEKRLTFRVDGLDAARFIQQLEFENIAATGRFDGEIPMVFDQQGGRIEKGRLTVREGGGTLAYVGELSNSKELGLFSKLAFDALKELRYKDLTIELDGRIDGEMVSRLRFDGVNARTPQPGDGVLVRKFLGLPFIFNVTIRAPFRGLLNSARTFNDPSLLLKQVQPLPETIQRSESR